LGVFAPFLGPMAENRVEKLPFFGIVPNLSSWISCFETITQFLLIVKREKWLNNDSHSTAI